MESIFHKIKSLLGIYQQVAGVEVVQQSDGYTYEVILVEKKRGEISILNTAVKLTSLEQLTDIIEQTTPIVLTANIRGVISKKTSSSQFLEMGIASVLPNANISTLYIQRQTHGQDELINIVRKEPLKELLLSFENKGFSIVGVYIGSFLVTQILPYLSEKSKLITNAHTLFFDQFNNLNDFNRVEGEEEQLISIGEDTLSNRLLVAYSGAFAFFTGSVETIALDAIATQKSEFEHQIIFKKAGLGILLFFLVVLLGNTFFYYHFQDKKNQMNQSFLSAQSALKQADDLKLDLENRKQFLQQTGINRNTKVSFIADQIGASIPDGIELLRLEVHPIVGNIKDYDPEMLKKYQKEVVIISGKCTSSLVYNEWLKILRTANWTKEVKHLQYQEELPGESKFELEIILL